MATDRSLATLLRALQSPSSDEDAARLLGSAATLLTLLTNPLNVTLLTSHVLSAPAVWQRPDGLRTSFRVFGAFHAASIQIIQQQKSPHDAAVFLERRILATEDWVKAVVKGADERSPRWKHILVLGGLLVGLEGHNRRGLSVHVRRMLEGAVVKAANLALLHVDLADDLATGTVCMVLGHVLDLLSSSEQALIDHDTLLPLLIEAIFFSKNGLRWGYFVGTMDADIVQGADNKFGWSPKSSSYTQTQRMVTGPLVSSLGSLSRLAAICVGRVKTIQPLIRVTNELLAFTKSLCTQWRQNKLSEVDITEESDFLGKESVASTLPLLWQVLKSALFAIVIIQRSSLEILIGSRLTPTTEAPSVAVQTLHTLRNIYFISSRLGRNPFSQYSFVYLASIDIVARYPAHSEGFLREIRPVHFGRISDHPQERCQDLYFFNTAEHFALFIPSNISEELLVAAALPYIETANDPRLLEIFEAAHSVMLSVFTAAQNSELIAKYLPFYIETIFKAFPQNLSPRQFRLALKTLIRVTAPPSPISETQPFLSSTLMEMVYSRIETASTVLLLPRSDNASSDSEAMLSEKAVMVLALIDSLPVLSVDALEEWLSMTAASLKSIENSAMLQQCRQRFWEVVSNGEMDVVRAEVCVTWWNTRGGRDMVLCGYPTEHEYLMSGALQETSKL